MLLVLMIAWNHRTIGISPEIPPLRVNFYIHADMAVPLIGPRKRMFIPPAAQKNPVRVMKYPALFPSFYESSSFIPANAAANALFKGSAASFFC